jgi:hypothetical protein
VDITSPFGTVEHMSDNEITIQLSGKLSYEDNISVSQAALIIAFLHDPTGTLGGAQPGTGGPGANPRGGVSGPRAALNSSGAKTNAQKIVALAAYVLQDGGDTFKLDAVKVQFQRARETMPKNPNRDLSSAIAAGWVEASHEPGEYYLTHAVDNVLIDGFSAAESSGTAPKKRTSSAKSRKSSNGGKATKPEAFAAIDDFPVVMDGFPGYHQMKANRDRLLWVLKFAKDCGIAGLSNQEIAWLTDHLGAGIPSKQITSVFGYAQKPGYATRSTMDRTIRIVPDGEAFLAKVGESN